MIPFLRYKSRGIHDKFTDVDDTGIAVKFMGEPSGAIKGDNLEFSLVLILQI